MFFFSFLTDASNKMAGKKVQDITPFGSLVANLQKDHTFALKIKTCVSNLKSMFMSRYFYLPVSLLHAGLKGVRLELLTSIYLTAHICAIGLKKSDLPLSIHAIDISRVLQLALPSTSTALQ